MPRRSNEFQRLVHLLHRQLHDRATVTESAMVADRTGGPPQEVDVLIEEHYGQLHVLIGVEVRDHSRRATIEWVQQMYGKHLNRTDKLVLDSRSGFTRTALQQAKQLGIVTMSLAEAGEVDWSGMISRLRDVFPGRFKFNILKGYAVLEEEYGPVEEPEIGPGELLYTVDEQIVGPVGEIAWQYLQQPDVGKKLMELFYANQDRSRATATFEVFPGSYLIDTSSAKRRVQAIKVEIECDQRMASVPLQHGVIGAARVSWGEKTVGDEQLLLVNTQQQGQPARATLRIVQGTELTDQLIDLIDETKP